MRKMLLIVPLLALAFAAAPPASNAGAGSAAGAALAAVEDPALRAALARLGAAVIGSDKA